MSELKNEILHTLLGNKSTEKFFDKISKYQNNLIKNHSNPVFNDEDKVKLLNFYNILQELGNLLYRYNTLKSNKLSTNNEQTNIENIILKGGISNTKYIWHSEHGEHTCKECLKLDGQEFDIFDNIPERPHPNCKCTVEITEYSDNGTQIQIEEEPCELINDIENLIENIKNSQKETEDISYDIKNDINDLQECYSKVQYLINNAETTLDNLSEDYGKHLPDCEYNIDKEYNSIQSKKNKLQNLLKDILGLLAPLNAFVKTLKVFISNYLELLYHAYELKEAEMDKYYHSKANCEATQEMGIIGEVYATLLSDLKEVYDQYTYVHTHKVSVEEAAADSERDQVANRLGRKRGREYPYCKCSTLMYDLLPDYKK